MRAQKQSVWFLQTHPLYNKFIDIKGAGSGRREILNESGRAVGDRIYRISNCVSVTNYTTQGYCLYMFTAFINDNMQNNICININLCSSFSSILAPKGVENLLSAMYIMAYRGQGFHFQQKSQNSKIAKMGSIFSRKSIDI